VVLYKYKYFVGLVPMVMPYDWPCEPAWFCRREHLDIAESNSAPNPAKKIQSTFVFCTLPFKIAEYRICNIAMFFCISLALIAKSFTRSE
jgi:hypothetical protein